MNIEEKFDKIDSNLESIKVLLTNISKLLERSMIIKSPIPKVEPVLKVELPIESPAPKVEPVLKVELPIESPAPKVEPVLKVELPKPVEPVESSKRPPIELLNLLNSKQWPHAVDPSLICDITSEQDKQDRAEGILDLIIDVHMENLKFLDFGCGEGHVVNKSREQKPKLSVGYDINKAEKWKKWEKTNNVIYTTDWNIVKNSGPYNVVLMYDVIDHISSTDEELVSKLKEIKSSMAPNGKVYVRTHPWCSRHGTHLYHQINKAFAHIVFTDDELRALGYKQEKTRFVKTPINYYKNIFERAGFKIQTQNAIREAVEPFFINNPLISVRIKDHYKELGKFPSFQLEQQFIDYVLI